MKYDPNTPAGRAMRKICQWLLDELESNYHDVVLVPAPDPQHSMHMVRVAQGQNAAWYRKFNQLHVSIRGRGNRTYKRPRTFIRKDRTATTLRRMIAGDYSGFQAERLVRFIERERANHRRRQQVDNDPQSKINFLKIGIPF